MVQKNILTEYYDNFSGKISSKTLPELIPKDKVYGVWFFFSSGNGLVLSSNKPLPDFMLMYHWQNPKRQKFWKTSSYDVPLISVINLYLNIVYLENDGHISSGLIS